MKNPPRTTKIRGQKHLLAYITPDEAKLLKARGGSGELHHGIPSYPDYGDAGGFSGSGGGEAATGGWGGGGGGGGQDRSGMQETLEAYAEEQAAAQAAIDQDIAEAEAIREDQAEMAADLASRPVAGLTRDEYNAMPSYMRSVYDTTGAYSFDFDDTGRVTGFTGPSVLGFTPGLMGLLTSFAPPPTTEEDLFGVYTGFGRMGEGEGPDFGGDGPDTVPAEYNPVTGQQDQCPDGYMFDEDLQACRLAGGLPGGDGTTGYGELGPATGDLYGRMGLLDIAPTGLGMFKQRFGAGFGTPSDFDTANMAFRRSGGVQRPYQGYTLLS